MNFHISHFSPMRPQLSSPNLGAPRSSQRHSTGTQHDGTHSGPVKIEVEPADDDVTSSGPDSDDDSGTDSLSDVSADDVTQDSRDVLVQRLADLAERLSGANVRASSVEALHKQVDEMEQVLRRGSGGGSRDPSVSSSRRRSSRESMRAAGDSNSRPRSLQLPSGDGRGHGHGHEPVRGRDALGIMAPMSPSWFMSQFQRRPSPVHKEMGAEVEAVDEAVDKAEGRKEAVLPPRVHSNSDSALQPQRPTVQRLYSADAAGGASTSPPTRISSEVAEDVVKEAEKLCAEMAGVIESLQTRREESDHLQSVLIQREEVAHQRVYEKTVILSELEDVVADNEAELRHLKLELRAIEVQCMGYVPKGVDPELTQSIRNWKEDWQVLREKWASRRGSSFVSGDEASTVSTLASPTSR